MLTRAIVSTGGGGGTVSRQAGPTRRDHAQAYVYGIVPGDTVVSRSARGVGDPPERVRLVRCGDIGALVSEIDARLPLGRPADLVAHKELLDAAAAQTPVLPLRFGAVLDDTRAVSDELLAPHHDDFAAALDELDGRMQFVVKGRYVESAMLREVLADSPQAGRLREEITSAADPASARDASIRWERSSTRRSAASGRPIPACSGTPSRRTAWPWPSARPVMSWTRRTVPCW